MCRVLVLYITGDPEGGSLWSFKNYEPTHLLFDDDYEEDGYFDNDRDLEEGSRAAFKFEVACLPP